MESLSNWLSVVVSIVASRVSQNREAVCEVTRFVAGSLMVITAGYYALFGGDTCGICLFLLAVFVASTVTFHVANRESLRRYGYRTMALVVALLILAIIAMTIGQRSPKEYTQYLPLWVAVASLVSASWPQCEAGTRGWPRPNRSQDVDLEAGSGSISLQSGAAATERSARTVDQWLERDAAIRSNCSGVTCQIQHVGGFIGPNGDVPDGSEGSVTTAGLRRCLPSVNPNWGRQTLSFFPEEFQSRSRTPKQQTGTSQSRPEHGSSPRQSMQSARSDQPLLSESRVD